MSMETQAKLLRVMQDREFMRLGGTKTIRVDVRIIAATNTELEEHIRQKAFRKDLFYRLNVIKIELPPLRDRKEDIPLLVKHFLDVYTKENSKDIEGVSEDVLEILERNSWPGNVRELENLIERAVVFAKSRIITRENLPGPLLSRGNERADAAADPARKPESPRPDARFPKEAHRNDAPQSQGCSEERGQDAGREADDAQRNDQATQDRRQRILTGSVALKIPGDEFIRD